MIWLVAGLIGAGVAWLSTGLAGAGLAFATNGSSRSGSRPLPRAAVQQPAAPQKPATGPFDAPSDGPFASPPSSMPTMRPLDSRRGSRAMSWLTSAREELHRSGLSGAPGFDERPKL